MHLYIYVYIIMKNPMDRGDWWQSIGLQNQIQLKQHSMHVCTLTNIYIVLILLLCSLENTNTVLKSESHSVIPDSLRPHGLSPWNSPGQNTGVGCLSFSRGSSQPRDRTQVSHIAGRFFTSWVTREAHETILQFCIRWHRNSVKNNDMTELFKNVCQTVNWYS